MKPERKGIKELIGELATEIENSVCGLTLQVKSGKSRVDIDIRPEDSILEICLDSSEFSGDQKKKLEELGFRPTTLEEEGKQIFSDQKSERIFEALPTEMLEKEIWKKEIPTQDFAGTLQKVVEEVLKLPPDCVPRVIPHWDELQFQECFSDLPYYFHLDKETQEALDSWFGLLFREDFLRHPEITKEIQALYNTILSFHRLLVPRPFSPLPESTFFYAALQDLLELMNLNMWSLSLFPVLRAAIEFWSIESFGKALTRDKFREILRSEKERELKRVVGDIKNWKNRTGREKQEWTETLFDYLREKAAEGCKIRLFRLSLKWLERWGYINREEKQSVDNTYKLASAFVHRKLSSRVFEELIRESYTLENTRQLMDIMFSSYLKILIEKQEPLYPPDSDEERHRLIKKFQEARLEKTESLLRRVLRFPQSKS
jgi:hypothetical protein